MAMRAYIAVSVAQKDKLRQVLTTITDTLAQEGFTAFVFVAQYRFAPDEEKQMMQKAIEEISSSDILIAETSCKAIGVGIEAGYAKALGKTVVYLRQADAAHSTTLAGLADYAVIYEHTGDLQTQLQDLLAIIRAAKENS